MRCFAVALLLLAGLAGCADDADPTASCPEDECPATGAATGAIRGVVVDQAIVPVEAATVAIKAGGTALATTETDAEGRFAFSEVAPGTYFLDAFRFGYGQTQASVIVEAGKTSPTVKIQINRLFDEEPFMEPFQFKGRLACHVQAGATAPCVTDWTQVVPGCGSGCVPVLRTAMGDARDFIYGVREGWQTHIVEATWTPSTSATSKQLGIIMRDFEVGGANHQYGEDGEGNPLHIRFEVGQRHPTQSGPASEQIPSEGYDQIIHFMGVRSGDDLAAVAIEQEFEVFVHTFYFGKPPEGWAFLNGDEAPF